MSWNCEVCYKGTTENHTNCNLVGTIKELIESVDVLTQVIQALTKKIGENNGNKPHP